jgi:hypothetical protein
VLQKERNCGSFTPWIQGFTPKEHKEMLDAKEMREWQAEQREKDRAWQEEQRKFDREWQESQKKADRRWHAKMVVLAAVLGAIVSVAGYILGKSH